MSIRIALVGAYMTGWSGLFHAIQAAGHEVVILTGTDEPLRKLSEPLRYERECEPVCVAQERNYGPEREVGRLRREMMAREKSNRHMLKKGRGR